MAKPRAFKRKREKRIRREANRIGKPKQSQSWASKQANVRSNKRKKVSMRTIRKRLRRRSGGGGVS